MTDALGDLVKIRTNLKNIADKHGLDVQFFTAVPGQDEEGPHEVMVLFGTKADQDNNDDQFEAIVQAEAQAEEKAKKSAMKEERFTRVAPDLDQIEKDLRGDGLLDD